MEEVIGPEVLNRAAGWMLSRGWREKLAKSRQYEQSLFEHSLIELDVLVQLLPILSAPHHYGLNAIEQRILTVAVLAHDIGKETDAWQTYVGRPQAGHWVSHVVPELTRAAVPGLCAALGFEELGKPVQNIMAHCIELHHSRPGRSDGAILEAMLSGGADRFMTLASLVKAVDHLCSASTAVEAEDAAGREPALALHLRVTRHELYVRGVSSTFLHRAAQTAFQEGGWKPLLYFSNGTMYGADPADRDHSDEPTAEEIRKRLKGEIAKALARDVTALIVGSPVGNLLPKPDLFSFNESREYLQIAAAKISPRSFIKKTPAAKRRVVETYWKLKGRRGSPTDGQVEEEAARLSVAQPEMLVFKLFKNMMDPTKIQAVGEEEGALASRLYEETFGAGSWAKLRSTTTLKPSYDMANTVDYFWALPGEAVDHPHVQRVAALPDQRRVEILINILNGIAQRVFAATVHPSPRDSLPGSMARTLIQDLLRPTSGLDPQALAMQQMAHYADSKPFAGKETAKGIYLCPICNHPFGFNDGIKASADFISNPQTHTNRGVAHGSFGYVMVCTSCYYERLLLQVLLGTRPGEVITLFPHLSLGPRKGEVLVRKVRDWVEGAKGLMRGEAGNLEWGFALGFTDRIAHQVGERDPFVLEPEDLLSLFRYRRGPDKQKARKREAVRRLKEAFQEDLEGLNIASGQTFASWEAATEALLENRIQQQEFRAIRRDVFRLYETLQLICETPNLIFVPLRYEVAAATDESETSKALRRLYVALLLSLVFDASVAIQKEGEPVDFSRGGGAAYVPPVPAVRSLVGAAWIPLAEARRWLAALGAAALLTEPTGLPVRSAMYQILASDPAERIARRIEEGGERGLLPRHLSLIEKLPGFRSRQEEDMPT